VRGGRAGAGARGGGEGGGETLDWANGGYAGRGRAVQVDPIKTRVESAWNHALETKL
jgi:hypothetical protein